MSKQIAKIQPSAIGGVFQDANSFDHWQRIAKALSSSSLIPTQYRGPEGMANTLVALEFANRVGASPLMVMQNLNIIEGRPAWSAKFVIASLEAAGYFLRYETENRGNKKVEFEYWEGPKGQRKKKTGTLGITDVACRVIGTDSNGTEHEGPWVSIEMAVMEGWYTRNGSKWKTMPEVMLRYRAASFFGNLYAPGMLMGLKTKEEVEDVAYTEIPEDEWDSPVSAVETINQQVQEDDEPEGEEYEETEDGTDPEEDELI